MGMELADAVASERRTSQAETRHGGVTVTAGVDSVGNIRRTSGLQAQARKSANKPRADHFVLGPSGKRYTDDQAIGEELPRRRHESNFFITINTNKAVPNERRVSATRIYKSVMDQIMNVENLRNLIMFGPKNYAHYGEDVFDDVIVQQQDPPLPSFDTGIEFGPSKKRLHSHTWLYIVHYSQIQISPQALTQQFSALWNAHFQTNDPLYMTKKPYVHIRLLPQTDWAAVMREYIHKAMEEVGSKDLQGYCAATGTC